MLVCLPHAGGSATFYRPVATALASAVDVLSVQYPGRQERRGEACITSITELADRVVDALAGRLDRPVALFGHSMGAVVGFEIALRLEAAGHPLTRMFASGRRAPSRPREETYHRLDDPALVAELQRLDGTESALLDDPELRHMILPAVRADLAAVAGHRPDPRSRLTCPITVLVGDNDPRTTVDEARSWAQHTAGATETIVLPGGHFYLIPHSATVIRTIADRLAPRPADVST